MIAALGKLSEDDIKAEICIVVCFNMNIKSKTLDIDLHFCGNRVQSYGSTLMIANVPRKKSGN